MHRSAPFLSPIIAPFLILGGFTGCGKQSNSEATPPLPPGISDRNLNTSIVTVRRLAADPEQLRQYKDGLISLLPRPSQPTQAEQSEWHVALIETVAITKADEAVPPLKEIIRDYNRNTKRWKPEVPSAALRALANIATPAAIGTLDELRARYEPWPLPLSGSVAAYSRVGKGEEIMKFARETLVTARESGECQTLFASAEAAMRRSSPGASSLRTFLTEFREREPNRWKAIFRRFTELVNNPTTPQDGAQPNWSSLASQLDTMRPDDVAEILPPDRIVELSDDQKAAMLQWLDKQGENPSLDGLGELTLDDIFKAMKAVVWRDSVKSAKVALNLVPGLRWVEDPSVNGLLFEALSVPNVDVSGAAVEVLAARLEPAPYAMSFFEFLSTKSSYYQHELDIYRKALVERCRVTPATVAAAFDTQVRAANSDLAKVSWVKKVLVIDVLGEIGTLAEIPTLAPFERDPTSFESSTMIMTIGNVTNQKRTIEFRDYARTAVRKIEGRWAR